jgi:hypothetical protein
MLRKVIVLSAVALFVVANAGPAVPKEWKQRYNSLMGTINKKDVASFKKSFDESFVTIDDKGKQSSRDEFFQMVDGLMANAKSVKTKEKLLSVKTQGDTVDVSFDFSMTVKHTPSGSTKVHEVGVDTWKKVGGVWKIIKTVDKTMTTTESKPKAKIAKKGGG